MGKICPEMNLHGPLLCGTRLTPRRWVVPVILVAVAMAVGLMWGYKAREAARHTEVERLKRLAPIANVSVDDGIDAREAVQIAVAFYRAAFGTFEGSVSEPIEKDGYWTSTVRKGFAESADPELIVINPRTGAVSGPGIGRFATFEAFKRFVAGVR
jgi:hypothetical protein